LLVLAFVVTQGRVRVAQCKWNECQTTFVMVRNGEWGWIDVEDDLVLTARHGSGGWHCQQGWG
jgi:hypothetical protein